MAELVVVIVEGPGEGREFALAGSVVAGRDPGAAVLIDDPEASREHVSITPRAGGAVLEDLGSTNGTYVGDERIVGPRELQPGDRFRIGTTVIELRGVAAPAAPSAPVPYAPPSDYPVSVAAGYPEGGIARWRPLVQWWLLIIPQAIVFLFVALVALVVIFVAWFAVIITGRWPRGMFDFVAGTGRWAVRLSGYYFLLTERYPPFSMGEEPDYPIRAQFPYPEQGIARWRPIVQWLLAIPHLIVLYVLQIVAFVCAIAAGFAILFTGRYPRGLYDIVLGYVRWQTRVNAYYYFLTERYPPFSLSA